MLFRPANTHSAAVLFGPPDRERPPASRRAHLTHPPTHSPTHSLTTHGTSALLAAQRAKLSRDTAAALPLWRASDAGASTSSPAGSTSPAAPRSADAARSARYTTAWLLVNTRSFYWAAARPRRGRARARPRREDCMALCPFVDYFNHGDDGGGGGAGAVCGVETSGGAGIRVMARRDYGASPLPRCLFLLSSAFGLAKDRRRACVRAVAGGGHTVVPGLADGRTD